MKHYLDLVPISARVNRRQTRLTRLCIVLAVFLIAGIFGMADMEIRGMTQRTRLEQGAWHAAFPGLTDREQSLIAQRPEVETSSRYAVTNYNLDLEYRIDGVKTGICGMDETLLTLFPALEIEEGAFPQAVNEALATRDMKNQLGLSVGDTIMLQTPDGTLPVTLSGFTGNNPLLSQSGCFSISTAIEHISCPIPSLRTSISISRFRPAVLFRRRLTGSAKCTIGMKVRCGRTSSC